MDLYPIPPAKLLSLFSKSSSLPGKIVKIDYSLRQHQRPCYVYVIDGDDRTKIGVTEDPKSRVSGLEFGGGKIFKQIALTPILKNGRTIESWAKNHFQERNIIGEWFHVPFDEMCEFVARAPWRFPGTKDELSKQRYFYESHIFFKWLRQEPNHYYPLK